MKKNKITAIIISAVMLATMAGSMITNSKTNKNISPQIKYTTLLSDATNAGNWVNSNGSWYYNDLNGNHETGWQQINGSWYDLDSNGVMQTGWQGSNGNWYYLNSSGAMQTGWQQINGSWYYLNSNGAMQTGWQQINGSWYYLNSDGTMQTGWQSSKGNWYYLNSSGAMQTGWQDLNGTWYYLNSNGIMQSGWQQISNTWYDFDQSGAMQTGWQSSNGNWYYLNSSGAMQTGWQDLSGTWYYLNSNGAMQTGNAVINGTAYTFNSNGALEANTNNTATVNSSVGLWLLNSPSMQGKTIKLMPFNSTVTVLEVQGAWTKISYEGIIGWCYNEYLTSSPTSDNTTNTNPPHQNNVKTLSIKGIDVSNFQGNLDFDPVKQAGYDTAIILAGDGYNNTTSPLLDAQYNSAKSANMNIGFYYVLRPNLNIEQQAQDFWSQIKNKSYDVYPVLDLEVANPNQDITPQVLEFLHDFKALSGLNCILYTSPNFANTHLNSSLAPYKCWLADWGVSEPSSNNIWNKNDLVGWQYTSTGKISGLSESLDLNKFNSGIYINPNDPYTVEAASSNSFAVENPNNKVSLANALGVKANSQTNSQTNSTPSMLVIK